jgi:hypothetical protein
MPTKFLETLGSKLAQKWVSTILTPAFLFWIGGLGAWIWRNDWRSLETWLTQPSQAAQMALLVGWLLVILISALLIKRFDLFVLRLLEGYWPPYLFWLKSFFLRRQRKKNENLRTKFQQLASKYFQNALTVEESDQFVRLDLQKRRIPNYIMPTELGNILRAAEEKPKNKYGLDAVICFPRLWLLLPENVQTELSEARTQLNTGARIWLWSVLFLVWTPFAWWAIPVSLISAYLSYRWTIDVAIVYGELIESVFDLYRTLLYKSLRFPLPSSPQEEKEMGQKVTQYLWGRDFEQLNLTFTDEQSS